MTDALQLSPDELAQVQPILARSSDWLTLENLLRLWEVFVAQVETGYEEPSYEYKNDLSARDLLEEVLEHAPKSVRAKLEPLLAPLDQRFLNATRPIARCLVAQPECRSYWWFRVPRRLTGELATDLKDQGIVG